MREVKEKSICPTWNPFVVKAMMEFQTWLHARPTYFLLIVCGWLVIEMYRVRRKMQGAGMQLNRSRSAALLETLYAGLGDACMLVAQSGEIVYVNSGAADLFGTPADLRGRRLSQVFPDPKVNEFLAKALALKEGSVEDEFVITIHPRGRTEQRYCVFNAAFVNGLDESQPLVRMVVRDETRRQETEQIRRDFVANASHELRTPLAIINGYLENLVDGDINNPEMVQKSLVTMSKHGERLALLVEDMLTISKFEAIEENEAAKLRDQSFHVGECVQGVLDRLQPMFDQKKASHRVEIEGNDELRGDRFYWDQVFFNLVENALKENADDGRLVITILMSRTPGEVTLRVRDNGIGIAHEHLPFIFKRFYRVAKDHSQEKVKGTGLGLSIVKRAVEAHGGTIRVESNQRLRTEFIITLPESPSIDSV